MGVVEQMENAPDGRRRLRLSNPATLERIGEFEVQTAAEVSGAIERARKAPVRCSHEYIRIISPE